MKWKCKQCGHEQPAHPITKPEEMPLCDQYIRDGGIAQARRDHTGKFLSVHACGGKFEELP